MSMTEPGSGSGSGDSLPQWVLVLATVSALGATALSVWTIVLQLKNYRKPLLQRWVVRILMMVPIYSLASLIALYSLDAAFLIDLVRDLYEAFCIYCFFSLLITYLGGERSLLILLHGREPTPHPWPINYFCGPLDISDPFSFLFLKRGILQYVQLKPVLAVITIILKATGTYAEGQFELNAGYTYISVVSNFSVTLSLYCLAMFWVCTTHDLKPFRPMPKFLCVKALIFFTFWQGLAISILVRAGILRSSTYTREHFSIAIQDTLLCFQMPLFAILHLYAFSHRDYMPSETRTYSGRLPVVYAFRDSLLGYKDVLDDSLTTFRGTGFSYRTFEPAEGGLHSATGDARARRARAGLRYADGGKTKYWLPMPGTDVEEAYGPRPTRAPAIAYLGPDASHRLVDAMEHPIESTSGTGFTEFIINPVATVSRKIREKRNVSRGYAPIAPEQADEVVHDDPRYLVEANASSIAEHISTAAGVVPFAGVHGMNRKELLFRNDNTSIASEQSGLEFGELQDDDEKLYKECRQHEFGDYNYPIVDASKEAARRQMRELEDDFIAGRSREWRISKALEQRQWQHERGKGKGKATQSRKRGSDKFKKKLPDGCIDILVEDPEAEEEEQILERERGEPALQTGKTTRLFRRTYGTMPSSAHPVSFPRETESIPGTPPPEEGETGQLRGVSTAKALPKFARLKHVDDGKPFDDGKDEHTASDTADAGAAEEISDQEDSTQKGSDEGLGVSSSKRLIPRGSQDPEHNPWD